MGKQVYISDEHHEELKIASAKRDQSMGEIVEEFIEQLDTDTSNKLAA